MEITAFHDVEKPQTSEIPMAQDTSAVNQLDDTFSIIQFLKRPVKLETFQVTSGDSSPVLKPVIFDANPKNNQIPIKEYTFPKDIMLLGGKLEKMVNQQFFKADIHVKIVLNANPFVCGRFYLTYSPYEDQVSDARKQRNASRAGVTAYPGVEIDAQLDNTVEIVIPYASYKEAYVLTSENLEDYVKMYLFALSPVRTGSSQAITAVIDFTVYAWFDNITINIPTCKPLPLLEEKYKKSYANFNVQPLEPQKTEIEKKLEHLQSVNPQAYSRILEMINRQRNPRSVEENWHSVSAEMQIQTEAREQGPIEDFATGVSGIAGALEPIPVIGEYAKIAGFVADIAGGIASIFGWSKPTSMQQVTDLANLPAKNYAHAKAIDNSTTLALSNENELSGPQSVFPSAADEMDIQYVCGNPAVKYIFPWKVGNPKAKPSTLGVIPVGIGPFERHQNSEVQKDSGGILTATYNNIPDWPTDPKGFSSRPFNGAAMGFKYSIATSILDTAPCEYVSQMFTYWRATMCFKISVVKTAFHVGRLEIFFDPGKIKKFEGKFDQQYYDNVDTANNYKYILDLTNDTEITIRIPYVSEQLFKRTIAANTAPTSSGLVLESPEQDIIDSLIGALVIRPVSNLLAPETVTDTIDLIVWKWAEDVVFNVPRNGNERDMVVYQYKNSSTQDFNLTRNSLYEYFGENPSFISDTILCNSRILPEVPFKCYTTKAYMQINIGNKAMGNVETFFNTGDIPNMNNMVCEMASGERLVNLRPLMRAFRTIKIQRILPNISVPFDFQKDVVSSFTQDEDDQNFPDYLSILSYMYRFFRGGQRLKFFITDVMPPKTQADESAIHMVKSFISNGNKDNSHIGPTHKTYPAINPVHEIAVPFYSKFRKLPISVLDNILTPYIQTNKECKMEVLRSGNDDLTLGWLMGTPQLSVGVGVVTVESWYATPNGAARAYQDENTCTSVAQSLPYLHNNPNFQIKPQTYKASMQMDIPDSFSVFNRPLAFPQENKQDRIKWRTFELIGRFMNEQEQLDWDDRLEGILAMAEFHAQAWDKGDTIFKPGKLRDFIMQGHAWIWDSWDNILTPKQRCRAMYVHSVIYRSMRLANA